MGNHWEAVGVGVACLAMLWFWVVQIGWVRSRTNLSFWRSVIAATLIVLSGSLLNAAAGVVLTKGRAASDTASKSSSK